MDKEEQIEEMAKLKTCPFCGGEAHIKIIDHDSHGKESYKVIISCGTWNCDVKREFYWFNTEKQAIECSIDLWNNRVDEPKLPEDSVVTSREEYEKLKDQTNIKCNIEDIRKAVFDATSCVIGYETAEKIYQHCFPDNPERFVKERKPSYNDGYFDGSKETAEKILNEIYTVLWDEKIREIATREGVEIKE